MFWNWGMWFRCSGIHSLHFTIHKMCVSTYAQVYSVDRVYLSDYKIFDFKQIMLWEWKKVVAPWCDTGPQYPPAQYPPHQSTNHTQVQNGRVDSFELDFWEVKAWKSRILFEERCRFRWRGGRPRWVPYWLWWCLWSVWVLEDEEDDNIADFKNLFNSYKVETETRQRDAPCSMKRARMPPSIVIPAMKTFRPISFGMSDCAVQPRMRVARQKPPRDPTANKPNRHNMQRTAPPMRPTPTQLAAYINSPVHQQMINKCHKKQPFLHDVINMNFKRHETSGNVRFSPHIDTPSLVLGSTFSNTNNVINAKR